MKDALIPAAVRQASKLFGVIVFLLRRPLVLPPDVCCPTTIMATSYVRSPFCWSIGIGSHDNVIDVGSVSFSGGATGCSGATAGAELKIK